MRRRVVALQSEALGAEGCDSCLPLPALRLLFRLVLGINVQTGQQVLQPVLVIGLSRVDLGNNAV